MSDPVASPSLESHWWSFFWVSTQPSFLQLQGLLLIHCQCQSCIIQQMNHEWIIAFSKITAEKRNLRQRHMIIGDNVAIRAEHKATPLGTVQERRCWTGHSWSGTVDGWNPATSNQLRLVAYPMIDDGFYTSQVVSRISEPSTVSSLSQGILN